MSVTNIPNLNTMNTLKNGDMLVNPGLTKRELLAAMAMQGLLAGVSWHRSRIEVLDIDKNKLAANAVACADALLEQLAQPKGS